MGAARIGGISDVRMFADVVSARALCVCPIEEDGTGVALLYTPAPRNIFLVLQLFLQNLDAVNEPVFKFKSGTTNITGDMSLAKWNSGDPAVKMHMENTGIPVILGELAGEAWNIDITTAGKIRGYAVMGERPAGNVGAT